MQCVVTQSSPVFRLDIPLQIEFSDGNTLMQSVLIEGVTKEIEIPTDRVVHAVRLDPHYTTLHATPEQWAEAEARRYLTEGKLVWDEEEFDQALAVFQEGLEFIPEVDPYGIEFLLRLHIGWLHQERGQFEEAMAEYELALDEAVRPAEFLSRLYLNLATVAKELGDEERTVWAAENVLNAERSLDKTTEHSRQAREMLSRT
jgi:tetratricopeptide (TPR) repeat protein